MTVLTAVQQACSVIGLQVPLAVYSATDRELVELQYAANEAADYIQRAYDWQALKKIATITGDGTTQDFTLLTVATDYGRMLQKATVWVTSRPGYPLVHETDTDNWLGLTVGNIIANTGMWTIYNKQIHIIMGTGTNSALASTDSAKFYYISSAKVMPASGSNKSSFTLDTDTFLLSERLLRLAVIYQWKANKGLPYSEDMNNYEIALQEAVSTDKGSKILTVGRQRWPNGGTEYAWPGTLGT